MSDTTPVTATTRPPAQARHTEASAKAVGERDTPVKKILIYGALIIFAIIYIYPFIIQLVTAFKTDGDAVGNPLSLVPDPFSTAAWERLRETQFPRWFLNSVVVTLIVTVSRVLFCSMAGYALARLKFFGRDAVFTALLAVMSVPAIVLLIPKFLVINYLGIYNSYPALFVPLMVDAAGVFIMKQFFEQIPPSIEEAARIDGAGPFRTFWSVVLPMARPALITITILSFQGSWNELGHFIIATNDQDLYTLTRGVAGLTSGGLGAGRQFPITMMAGLLMTIPTALVFIIFQRYFTQGANVGAEKG
ncbi:carbohydrate ABC transporter permease [Ornithinimicrobium tianjinense]|uniref:Sn-glycerol-3-phosphate transport system permease protein UgpE n=1 Tax=Ornithinimicrobium tianjinense TaxID=1195761 RepID=A0A917BRA6_9MICO|nr:carbohydrate ABC transporter permease [Ornithinimicrobium tianjinense]GGF53973.1 sn-glycerol-3-phosphate transport system permease protein UgpE [Ornithinimicrobium tianjinense]